MDQREAFAAISEVVIDAYVIVDSSGDILDFNRAFFALFPRQVARKLKGMVLGDALAMERDVASECMESDRHVRLDEIPMKVSGGDTELRVILSAIPLKGEGRQLTGALVIIRNVTDEAMMQVKYQEMLESEARERERIVAQMRERTGALVETNELLLDLQRELMDLRRGLWA